MQKQFKSPQCQLAEHSLAATKEEQLEEKKIEKKPKLAPCLQMFQCALQLSWQRLMHLVYVGSGESEIRKWNIEEEKLHLNKVRVRQILIRFWSGFLAAKTRL